ncbi:Dihydropteroate synthase [Thalassovita gelatinovora]|uniref:Dihydropteroate synthase n=1 Tax=Thalassovita gelatinovora TaxID=53501 RepID=A0A0P1FZ30_THAGE|nr:dihydropteroate synthase [Thalassovita gelatinovora]QIZ79969.1 dihydropteroate synthase [Thalassovita gelatinovora]CUH65614.1 Dihydropteroate synthase [Thalassovita gelatinovora]SER06176.1 Dihydropteroate synthase [Thalassovita gelatinovora]
MTQYYRPLVQSDPCRPDDAYPLAGGWAWFQDVEVLSRDRAPQRCPARHAPDAVLQRLTAVHAPIAGLDISAPRVMGILNVTPDSFSDGGQYDAPERALAHARTMAGQGADIIDIGGESTRPGAVEVPIDDEIHRTAPVIQAIRAEMEMPISIDTRKCPVAQAAIEAGADLVNDVAGFTFDPGLALYCGNKGVPVCVMHAQGDPETMQAAPHYDDVLLDVYDFLAARIDALLAAGIDRTQIMVDPGIGFGKTLDHNLALLKRISLFHSLGCPILLGVSRKKFIGTLGNAPDPADRAAGSVALALAAVAQGVQVLRVHDVFETRSALNLWQAVTG